MAAGRRHEAVNLVVLGGLAAVWYWSALNGRPLLPESVAPLPARVAFIVSYLVGTFLVTPDLDMGHVRVRARKHWGVLGVLWLPYGAVFRHRGLSHSWVIGPLTRLIYLLMLALALLELFRLAGSWLGYAFEFRLSARGDWLPLLGGSAAGYYVSQWLHLLLDGYPGKRRRRLR